MARPISGPGLKKNQEKTIHNTWAPPATAEGPQIHTKQYHAPRPRFRAGPVPSSHTVRKHQSCLFKTFYLSGKIYTDQTGRFPVTSSRGNKYILVAYHFDSNTIHAEPLKTRSGLDLTTAYQKLHSLLTNRGLLPHLHILDNECPNVLQTFMREVNKQFQLI